MPMSWARRAFPHSPSQMMLLGDNSQTGRIFGTLTQRDTMLDTASVWTGCVANIAEHQREEAKLVRGLDSWSAHGLWFRV
jgi:hypothetical protein